MGSLDVFCPLVRAVYALSIGLLGYVAIRAVVDGIDAAVSAIRKRLWGSE